MTASVPPPFYCLRQGQSAELGSEKPGAHLRFHQNSVRTVNILVTSAAGANGDGYGSILIFTIVAFDFDDGRFLGPVVRMDRLIGQAIVFFSVR